MNGNLQKIHVERLMVRRAAQRSTPVIFMENEHPIIAEEEDAIVEHVLQSNLIGSFDTLKSDIKSILHLDDWEVICTETSLHIYKLVVEPNGNLKIQTSIMVDCDFILKVFHQDKAIGLKFTNQTIYKSLRLKHWSHLQKLIDKFNNPMDLQIHAQKIRYE